MMEEGTNQANRQGPISKKRDTFSRRAPGRSAGAEGTAVTGGGSSRRVTARDLPGGQEVEAGDSHGDDPEPMRASVHVSVCV